jgi:hypothetical protein
LAQVIVIFAQMDSLGNDGVLQVIRFNNFLGYAICISVIFILMLGDNILLLSMLKMTGYVV